MSFIALMRSLFMVCIYPFVVIFFSIFILLLGIFEFTRDWQDLFVGEWARLSLLLFGVRIKCVGTENLPTGGYIALFNHTSNFDIFAIQSIIPKIRFGAKIELFKIPIFGHAMRAAKALPIARTEIKKVLEVYEEASQRIVKGECFILSPEGTRQPTETLGPFKSGPFLLAIKSQAPIVPIAIQGASQIQSKGSLIPNSKKLISEIKVTIGEPISTVGLTPLSKSELQETARNSFKILGLK